MSGKESILTRWSRRKREAAKPRDAEPDQSPPSRSVTTQSAQTKDAASLPLAEPALDPTVDLTKLPPLDSITAETDLSVFFARGVPSELRHAALRRAWAADPSIRDFVGLTENDWDVLAPAAAAGVKPLAATDEMRQWVDELFARPRPAGSEAGDQSAAEARELASEALLDAKTEDIAPDVPASPPEPEAETPRTDGATHKEVQETPSEEVGPPERATPAQRSHGRALPR